MKICNLTLVEALAYVANLRATLRVEPDGLYIDAIVPIPDELQTAPQFHKEKITRLVSAFPGERWPGWRMADEG
ncbi:MAG: hypothetical protein KDJ52_15545 [Anaerolineae bacterium]|nr:hypothetical protein [Anaerolineae bacterium]